MLVAFILSILTQVLAVEKYTVDHSYYLMSLEPSEESFKKYLVNMSNSQVYQSVSAAELVKSKFEFPFYGHYLNQFYVTTRGFLSLAPRIHSNLRHAQYIAPYMFNIRLNNTQVHFKGDENKFKERFR